VSVFKIILLLNERTHTALEVVREEVDHHNLLVVGILLEDPVVVDPID
jgi:hypothetical protein